MSRKNEILDALIEIFNDKGLDANFSMSELARRVDIGKSTIYEYFGTKDEILSEAMIRIFERAIEAVNSRVINPDLGFEASLKEELKFTFELSKNSSNIFRYIMPMENDNIPIQIKQSGIAKELKKTGRAFETRFREIMVKGVQEGQLHITDITIQGTLFAALISGSISRIGNINVEQTDHLDMDQYIDAMYQLVLHIFK